MAPLHSSDVRLKRNRDDDLDDESVSECLLLILGSQALNMTNEHLAGVTASANFLPGLEKPLA